jgi:hypothetical protein
MNRKSESWDSRITFLEENNGELEIEVELTNGKQKRVYNGYLN